MKKWGRAATATVALLLGLTCVAAPASAATISYTDPSGDAESFTTPGMTNPKVDILSVTVDATDTDLEIRVEVGEPVALSSDDWHDMILAVLLADESDTVGDVGGFAAGLATDGSGSLKALLGPTSGGALCEGDAALDGSEYVLTFGTCVRSLPRTMVTAAIMATFTAEDAFFDAAPDDLPSDPVTAFETATDARLAGTDRIETAIALSKDIYSGSDAKSAVLATAFSYPDALTGAPLARAADGPLLLTGSDGLDDRVRAELQRVVPAGATVYVLGGTAALSDNVLTQLQAAGYTPKRLAGNDRFGTAIQIAQAVDDAELAVDEFGGHVEVLLADGLTYTDALIASAAAPSLNGVVILTSGSTLPPESAGYLAGDESDEIAIGAAAVAARPDADGYTGQSPADLSRKVADGLLPHGGIVALATQTNFPDALAGAAHVSALGGTLLLTDPAQLSPEAHDALVDRRSAIRQLLVYGGTAAISDQVVEQARAAITS